LQQPAFTVQALDTTAAGDTFCGTLVAALAAGAAFADALRRACADSALACTRLGAQTSVPAQNEVLALLHTAVAQAVVGGACAPTPSGQNAMI
ncbi:PfkB family carbohydrate kinase, partial [Lysobacter sp. 2RAB21]